jgi:uncharacterized membrane protein
MFPLATIFSLLVGIAGWYYAFYSPAAERLGGVESDRNNRLRIRLRRVNGGMMCLLAVCLFLGAAALEKQWKAVVTIALWAVVVVLLFLIGMLAMIDLRLTTRLRYQLRDNRENRP